MTCFHHMTVRPVLQCAICKVFSSIQCVADVNRYCRLFPLNNIAIPKDTAKENPNVCVVVRIFYRIHIIQFLIFTPSSELIVILWNALIVFATFAGDFAWRYYIWHSSTDCFSLFYILIDQTLYLGEFSTNSHFTWQFLIRTHRLHGVESLRDKLRGATFLAVPESVV